MQGLLDNHIQQRKANILMGFGVDLQKSHGEGSRGGKVIGHTKSGKPIYAGYHNSYEDFTSEEHKQARNIHEKKAAKHYDTLHNAGASVSKRKKAGEHYRLHIQQADYHMNSTKDY